MLIVRVPFPIKVGFMKTHKNNVPAAPGCEIWN